MKWKKFGRSRYTCSGFTVSKKKKGDWFLFRVLPEYDEFGAIGHFPTCVAAQSVAQTIINKEEGR